jgi:hypothetical protein
MPEFYKVPTVIPQLIDEAREWHRYYKLNNIEPTWFQFKTDILDIFQYDSKTPN